MFGVLDKVQGEHQLNFNPEPHLVYSLLNNRCESCLKEGSIVLHFSFLKVSMFPQASCFMCSRAHVRSTNAGALLIRPMIVQSTYQPSCLHKVFSPSFNSSEQYSCTAPSDAPLPLCLKGMSHFLLKWPISIAYEKVVNVCQSSKQICRPHSHSYVKENILQVKVTLIDIEFHGCVYHNGFHSSLKTSRTPSASQQQTNVNVLGHTICHLCDILDTRFW